jgi:hypothetical protein
MKLAGDPNNSASFKDDARADQLSEEIIRHLRMLVDGGILDVEAMSASNSELAEAFFHCAVSISATRRDLLSQTVQCRMVPIVPRLREEIAATRFSATSLSLSITDHHRLSRLGILAEPFS